MRFYELDQKIKEQKNYKLVAKYIIENNIDLNNFLNKIFVNLNEEVEQKPGFFQKIKQNLSNMWNKFRGNPYDVDSVAQILQKVYEFLNNNPEMQKRYGEEIDSLANTIQSIKSKSSGGSEVSRETKPEEKEIKKAEKETRPGDTEIPKEIIDSYLKRLTYGQPLNIDAVANKDNYIFYAKELASYPQQNEIENTKNKLMKDLKEKIAHVEKVGVSLTGDKKIDITKISQWQEIKNKYLNHETWALWDIGKQLHLSKNPSKSSAGYALGNPITDEKIQQDIVNRMVGWAVTGGGKNTDLKRISSKDLILVGERAIGEKPLFSSTPSTPTPTPTPTPIPIPTT